MQNILPGGPHHWLHWTLDTWHTVMWCVMPHAGSGRCVCVLSRQLLAAPPPPPPSCCPAPALLLTDHCTSLCLVCSSVGDPGHTQAIPSCQARLVTRGVEQWTAVDPGWGRGLRDAICAFPQTINPPNILFLQIITVMITEYLEKPHARAFWQQVLECFCEKIFTIQILCFHPSIKEIEEP